MTSCDNIPCLRNEYFYLSYVEFSDCSFVRNSNDPEGNISFYAFVMYKNVPLYLFSPAARRTSQDVVKTGQVPENERF